MSNVDPLAPPPSTDASVAPARSTLDPKTLSLAVYALYLASVFTFGVLALAGVIIAYIIRGDAPEWLKSHFEFQIRSFWIGLAASIIGWATVWVLGLGFLVLAATALWFIARAVVGLDRLLKNQPHPNPKTWMFLGD